MDNAFRFLTGDDERHLAEKAVSSKYDAGAVILEEGSRRKAIFRIRSGKVRVERAHLGRGIGFARLGAGEMFGEMSFLESVGASASIIAEEPTEIDVIDGALIGALLESVPGFAARFYHSLAALLSQRLRETSSLLPHLMVEDVPQVNRFHAPRASQATKAPTPPTLIAAVETFKTAMMHADRALKDKKSATPEIQEQVSSACGALTASLRTHIEQEEHLEKSIGAYVFRETFSLFMLSVLLDRSYTKPRGYAGDYYTIEMIYEDVEKGDGRLGPLVDRWMRQIPATRAVKNRRPFVSSAIRQAASAWRGDGPAPITSLASGPARELFDIFAAKDSPEIHATCIDIDNEALAFVAEASRKAGIESRLTLSQENVIRLSRGRGKTALGPQQMIYSIGLIDYLQDPFVVKLLDWVHDHLVPGGTVMVGNFDTSNPDKAFMDHILEWQLIHRSPADMQRLFAESKFGKTPVEVKVEDAGVNLFAVATRQ